MFELCHNFKGFRILLLFIFSSCPALCRPAVLLELITTSPTHVAVKLCSSWGYWTAFILLLRYTYRSIPHTQYSSPFLPIRHYWGPHTCGIFVMWPDTDRIWMPLVSFVKDKPNHCGHAVHSIYWVRMSLGMEVCLYSVSARICVELYMGR
jgi:hypothetical protein